MRKLFKSLNFIEMTKFNLLSTLALCLSLSLLFSSCGKEESSIVAITNQEIPQDDNFFQDFVENIAFTNLNKLKLNETEFVYELTFQNFGESDILPEGFGFNNLTIMDNGEGNDRIANDGIYTSLEQFSIAELGLKVQFEPICDEKFKHKKEIGISNEKILSCEFQPCGCPCSDGTCPACTNFGWSCWELISCTVGF